MRWLGSLVFVLCFSAIADPSCPSSLEGGAPVTYADVKPLLDSKCSICHKGPFLDTSVFPFTFYASQNQAEIVGEFIRLMKLPEDDWDRMPPKNGPSISQQDIQKLEAWLRDGLLR